MLGLGLFIEMFSFGICIYLIYKIGNCYFKAMSVQEGRDYKGYFSEITYLFSNFPNVYKSIGIMPIPYVAEDFTPNEEARRLLKKRNWLVGGFYLFFVGTMILQVLLLKV